jgi:arylsulfatase A-like enzyme
MAEEPDNESATPRRHKALAKERERFIDLIGIPLRLYRLGCSRRSAQSDGFCRNQMARATLSARGHEEGLGSAVAPRICAGHDRRYETRVARTPAGGRSLQLRSRARLAVAKWTRRELLAAGTAGLTLGLPRSRATGSSDAAGPVPAKRPNIIIFMPDELRADALACYGNPVIRTPNFDRLARSGTRFENCHVQFPVCGASRCSMATGWPTSVRGHRSLYYFLQPDEPNMFRYLLQAGYDVYMYGKNDVLAGASVAGSLTQWRNPRPPASEFAAIDKPQYPTTMLFPPAGERRATVDYAALQLAIEVLERQENERPFCILLSLFEPHPPYTIPADFYHLYRPSEVPAPTPPGLPRRPRFHEAMRNISGLNRVSEAEFRQVRAVYYGQVSYSDWLLGELLEAIERTSHSRDTALVVCSDHGDYTGDYGLVEKWPSGLEDCLTHVPLFGSVPGGTPGHVASDLVELYDVMATCLDLGGTTAAHTNFARSLLPQLHGLPGDAHRAAFTEGGYNTYEPQAFEPVIDGLYSAKTRLQNEHPETITRCAAIRTDRYKLIVRPNDQSELYDCQKDPAQKENLFADLSVRDVQNELQARLTNWYVDTSGVPPEHRDPRGAAVLDRPANLSHVEEPSKLLDH